MDDYLQYIILIILCLLLFGFLYALLYSIWLGVKRKRRKIFIDIYRKYIRNFSSDKFDELDDEGKFCYYSVAKSAERLVSSKDLVCNEELERKMLDVITVISYIESNLKL